MKTLLGVLAAAGAAATLGFSAPSLADDPSAKPQTPPWGFDLAGRDTSVTPGGDFYTYANGDYVKTLVIPPDRSRSYPPRPFRAGREPASRRAPRGRRNCRSASDPAGSPGS